MRLLLPALSWAICVAAAQRQRFAAVDEDNLVPRYLVDQSFPLARRAGVCGQGAHSCTFTYPPSRKPVLCDD